MLLVQALWWYGLWFAFGVERRLAHRRVTAVKVVGDGVTAALAVVVVLAKTRPGGTRRLWRLSHWVRGGDLHRPQSADGVVVGLEHGWKRRWYSLWRLALFRCVACSPSWWDAPANHEVLRAVPPPRTLGSFV